MFCFIFLILGLQRDNYGGEVQQQVEQTLCSHFCKRETPLSRSLVERVTRRESWG